MFAYGSYLRLLFNGQLQQAQAYRTAAVPTYLYKFYTLLDENGGKNQRALRLNRERFETLAANQNWFDFACNQNDPFELNMVYINEELAQAEGLSDAAIDALKACLQAIKDQLILCSFNETDVNNLPMWATYANNHRGYCIRYRVTQPELIRKVTYGPNRIGIVDIMLSLLREIEESVFFRLETEELEIYRELLCSLYCIKHTSWQAEQEYRIILATDGKKGRRISDEKLGLVPTDLYIGINCSKKHRKRLTKIGLEDLNCRVLQGEVSDTEFIVFRDVANPKKPPHNVPGKPQ